MLFKCKAEHRESVGEDMKCMELAQDLVHCQFLELVSLKPRDQ
jgi:hypothetical protein